LNVTSGYRQDLWSFKKKLKNGDMDYQELKLLEDDLWDAADQLRANSKLTASEYSMPVLGLIFLRHATTRFHALLPDVEKAVPARATGALREDRIKLGFQGKAAIYLPETARYDYLAALPSGINVGEAIRDAMIAIEDSVTDQKGQKLLEGALPKDYLGLEQDLLAELLKIFNRPALQTATGDVFGRIYEYFLNQFAQSGAQEGGEFFTPPSLVRMIVNVIEPDHGVVLDPACGSAGMFVQTGHFIEEVRHKSTNEVDITFYGQEKADLNSKLARMNLAVHGLEGNIRIGNTFYEDHHKLVGACDYVMANPPFNVDGVQVAKVKSQVGEKQTGRLPFGLPGVATKTKGKNNGEGETISNANSLWLQYFYSYLNNNGRAGFVMASSASDAGNKDKEIRQKLVETGHVDVMISIGPKFFYTRTLPCALWFFDKGKPGDLLDTVLMIDARNIYTVVSARSHVFTEEQLANLTAITWLYRGEQEKFVALLASYQCQLTHHLAQLADRLANDEQQVSALATALRNFSQTAADDTAIAAVREKLGEDHGITDELLHAYRAEVQKADEQADGWRQALDGVRNEASTALKALATLTDQSTFDQRKALQEKIESINPALKAGLTALEARHKAWLKLLDLAEKSLRARQWATFYGDAAREAKKTLLPRDVKKREKPTGRDLSMETFKRATYFIAQGHWLLSRFPDGLYNDVPGLCKAATRKDIAGNDFSLTPGRYVGVAIGGLADDSEVFANRMREIQSELHELNAKALGLIQLIEADMQGLLE
jgi:type I restriction enzyme M protein